MALTKSFDDLVRRRVARDTAFGAALLREAIDRMLAGDVDAGTSILRDYMRSTIGSEKLAELTAPPKKSDPHV